jgi:selenocysteine-specific translation elongation factor
MPDAAGIAAITGGTSAVIAWIGYLNGRRQATVALETNERQARAATESAERQAQVELAKVTAETDRFHEEHRRGHTSDLRRVYLQYVNAIDAQTAAGEIDFDSFDEKVRVLLRRANWSANP